MKIYFTQDGHKFVTDVVDPAMEPQHVAAFALTENQSKLVLRYSLVDNVLTDDYPGKTDEEVAAAIYASEVAEAERLAALHAPKT